MKLFAVAVAMALFTMMFSAANAADANAGASIFNARGCVGCHGASGKQPIANYPVVGGKPAEFITEQLTRFRSGERNNPIMMPMAAGLSDADIANLAAYLSAQ